MDWQALGDKADAWTDTHIHEWFREGGIQLEVLRYLGICMICSAIGTLLVRVVHSLGNRRRDTLARRRKREGARHLPHAKTARARAPGSGAKSEVRWAKNRAKKREAVPDVKDTCAMM
jgi:hypothetical protein